MCYKNLISSVILLAFLSCSPDQEVLQKNQFSEEKEVFYEILDINEFGEKDREKLENLLIDIGKRSFDKTEASINLINPQAMTGPFSVSGVVYDEGT